METYIALFRGINVGGKNIIKMKELRQLLTQLGFQDVQTYIQSGNAVFQNDKVDSTQMSERIQSSIQELYGFEPRVLVIGREAFDKAIAMNPFKEAEAEPKRLHLNFLASVPENPDLDALRELSKPNERFELIDRVFYLHAPDGIGRSKLATNTEKHLGVPATSRNWRTVLKISEMTHE